MASFQHYFTIREYSGTITPAQDVKIIENATETFTEAIISNDSKTADIQCYVNTGDNPFTLFPEEKLEFEFIITNIVIKNLSTTNDAFYRVFLKERVEEYIE